jgi:hypothetical protein
MALDVPLPPHPRSGLLRKVTSDAAEKKLATLSVLAASGNML